MAMFENLEWKLSAEDTASQTFKKVADAQSEVSTQSKTMTENLDSGASSWQNIAKGVFAGQAAFEAAKASADLLNKGMSDTAERAAHLEATQKQLNEQLAFFDELKFDTKSIDNAQDSLEDTAKTEKDVTKRTDEMADSVDGATTSWKNIAKGVVGAQIVLELARKTIRLLKDQMGEAMDGAMEYQRVQAQLNAAIESTGGAAGLTISDLNEMADGMMHMADGGGEAINALQSQLLSFTNISKDTFQETTQAALDLTTRLNNGVLPTADQLKSTAIQLGKAINNPTKGLTALTRVGVEFTEQQQAQIKTMQEAGDMMGAQRIILEELSKEYGGSAAAAAKTFEGRVVQLNNVVSDARKLIGLALIPTLAVFADQATDATGKIKTNEDTMYKWQLRIYQASVILKGAIGTVANFGKATWALAKIVWESVQTMLSVFGDLGSSLASLGNNFKVIFKAIRQGLTGDFGGALETMRSGFDDVFVQSKASLSRLGNAFAEFGSSLVTSFDPMDAAIEEATNHEAFDQMLSDMKAAEAMFSDFSGAGADMGDGVAEGSDEIKKALETVSGSYEDARGKIDDELLKLEEAHSTNVDKIKEKLQDLNAALAETTAEYQKTIGEINRSEAEGVVEQEQKIADLKSQIAELQAESGSDTFTESDQARLTTLQSQLAQEETAYNDYIQNLQGLDAELAEARRRASLTDFQRFIEDINAKRTEEQDAYNARIAEIQAEVKEQQDALDEENRIYEAKKAIYAQVDASFQEFHDHYLANLDEMGQFTSETVIQMQSELAQIVSLFEEIQAVRSNAALAGVSLDGASAGSGESSGASTTNITQQVTITVQAGTESSASTAEDIVAEIQRQLELAAQASQ